MPKFNAESEPTAAKNPSQIKNKDKRARVIHKLRIAKKKDRRKRREDNQRANMEAVALGEEAPRKISRTQENSRIDDPTMVQGDDEEVFGDEAGDEFAAIFSNCEAPKIMLTTRPRPSKGLFRFIGDLMNTFPNTFYYPRKEFDVKTICGFASNKNFTHLIVLGERRKECNGMLLSRLPAGPTAFFKVSNVEISADLASHGRTTDAHPEVILNNFHTRLGRRVGRFLGSMVPHAPQFRGRQVVTFHNQRDFIFVRHHRYIFDEEEAEKRRKFEEANAERVASGKEPILRPGTDLGVKTKLQELGPRFTLKLRWLQQGAFDTLFGEYEWLGKRGGIGLQEQRTKFNL